MPVMHALIAAENRVPPECSQHPKTLNTKQALKTPKPQRADHVTVSWKTE